VIGYWFFGSTHSAFPTDPSQSTLQAPTMGIDRPGQYSDGGILIEANVNPLTNITTRPDTCPASVIGGRFVLAINRKYQN
jgi:hypothetical protein